MKWRICSSRKRKQLLALFLFLPMCIVLFPHRTTHDSLWNLPHTDPAPNDSPSEQDCPFRNSPLFRSIFVYPNPHTEAVFFDQVRSSFGETVEWPWILQREAIRRNGTFLYDVDRPSVTQFSLDLIVYEILTNSCLRSWNPETAKLFLVPFLPSVFRRGGDDRWSHDAVPHASAHERALADAMMGRSLEGWERVFGLTGRYWKRRRGTDHVVVMPEPLHGLHHPRGKRGFYHYIKTQKQLMAPIVVSVEVSRTFVETYPHCSQKNILVPYPNIDGRWYNGFWEEQAESLRERMGLPAEKKRPWSVYYDAGNHGECLALRKALQRNHQCESEESMAMALAGPRSGSFPIGMRMATFCPCPGGDSPSAKRMFDAVLAGCIPVVLSHDFVWPFVNDDSPLARLHPSDFSLALDSTQFNSLLYHHRNTTTDGDFADCQRIASNDQESLNDYLRRSISPERIASLQNGVKQAAQLYSYFETRKSGPDNPLQAGVAPFGGAALRLVEELALRAQAGSEPWDKCKQEKAVVLEQTKGKMVQRNKC